MPTGLSIAPSPPSLLQGEPAQPVVIARPAEMHPSSLSHVEISLQTKAVSDVSPADGLLEPRSAVWMRLNLRLQRIAGCGLPPVIASVQMTDDNRVAAPVDNLAIRARQALDNFAVKKVEIGHRWPQDVKMWSNEADLEIDLGGSGQTRRIAACANTLTAASRKLHKYISSSGGARLSVPDVSIDVVQNSLASLYEVAGCKIDYDALSPADLVDHIAWAVYLEAQQHTDQGKALLKQIDKSQQQLLKLCDKQFYAVFEALVTRDLPDTTTAVVEWASCHEDIVRAQIAHLSGKAVIALLESKALIVDRKTWTEWRAQRAVTENFYEPSVFWSVEANYEKPWRILSLRGPVYAGGYTERVEYMIEAPESVMTTRHEIELNKCPLGSSWKLTIADHGLTLDGLNTRGRASIMWCPSVSANLGPVARVRSNENWAQNVKIPSASAWCQGGKIRFRIVLRVCNEGVSYSVPRHDLG